jgi:hypothetical protein
MKRMLLSLLGAVVLALPGHASEPIDAAAAAAIQTVIERQLDAFQRDDGNEAFSYASPAIQQQFGSVEVFMHMVRTAYPAVYRAAQADFQTPRTIGDEVIQEVIVTGQDGVSYLAVYTMEQQSDRSWRINGCSLFGVPDVTI